MKGDLVQYLSDALSRIEAGGVNSPSGSWVAGIFGKAANGFEKEIRSYVSRLLSVCQLDYEGDLRGLLKGPPYGKATLGVLTAVVKEATQRNSQAVAAHIPGGWKASGFVSALEKINDAWVDTKHGKEVLESTMIAHMKSILALAKMLRAQQW